MKTFRMIAVACLLLLAGCGGDADIKYDAAHACYGGDQLIISNYTPTTVALASSGTTTIPEAFMLITNVNCEKLAYEITVAGWVIDTQSSQTFAKNVRMTITNIAIPESYVTGTMGFVDIMASTPTRTSNTVHIEWTKS